MKEKYYYKEVIDDLKNKIMSMDSNEKLPTERELCKIYNVSRFTIRNALQKLQEKGYITRIQGLGTFVSEIKKDTFNLSNSNNFNEIIKSSGSIPRSEILDFKIIPCNIKLKKEFNSHFKSFYFLKRLRFSDNQTIMIEETYLPVPLFKNLEPNVLNDLGLYNYLEKKYNQSAKIAYEDFSSTYIDRATSKYLDIKENSHGLKMIRRTYNNNNIMFEYTESIANTEKFIYRVMLQNI